MKLRYLVTTLNILSIVSVFIGVSDVTPLDLFQLIEEQIEVLLISRLRRLASILIAGASMSITGLIMQQLSRNKFVSPTTAGTMDAASLGVLVSLLVFTSASSLNKMIVAFAFALLGTFIFMKFLEKIRLTSLVFIVLVGLMFGIIISSLARFIAYRYDLIQNMTSFMLGDFSMFMTGNYELMFINVPTLIFAYFYANKF